MNRIHEFPSRPAYKPTVRSRALILALPVVFALTALIATTGCSRKSPQELVEDRCTGCHALTTITRARKTRQEWETTVNRLVDRGARLNDRQVQEVIATE